jgi:ribonuclease VapC
MILDTSALAALVFQEPEAERIARAIASATARRMSCVNWLETMVVVQARRGPEQVVETMALLADMQVEMLPFDERHMRLAQTAWQRFGKGRHPARLNILDCCAYAASMSVGEPLLYVGDDFARTDIVRAPW